jgi:hypothetical protein
VTVESDVGVNGPLEVLYGSDVDAEADEELLRTLRGRLPVAELRLVEDDEGGSSTVFSAGLDPPPGTAWTFASAMFELSVWAKRSWYRALTLEAGDCPTFPSAAGINGLGPDSSAELSSSSSSPSAEASECRSIDVSRLWSFTFFSGCSPLGVGGTDWIEAGSKVLSRRAIPSPVGAFARPVILFTYRWILGIESQAFV